VLHDVYLGQQQGQYPVVVFDNTNVYTKSIDDEDDGTHVYPADFSLLPKEASFNKPVEIVGRAVTAAWSRNVDTFYHFLVRWLLDYLD
jgi:hypothetical protein